MLDYFAATCPSNGEWTQAALNDAKGLIGVIEAISKDENCRTLGGALGQLATLQVQVTELAQMSETKKQIAAFDAQERELLIEISKSTSQLDIDSMNTTLRSIQMGRAALLGRESAQKDLSGTDTVLALSRAAQVADSAFAQVAANQKCQENHPMILSAATGLLTSVGTAISAVNPALGLGLQAGSSFMGSAIETFRTARYNSGIREISEGSTAYQGFKCALETMTNRWCDMVDAQAFIEYKTQLRRSHLSADLAQAFRLNDRELPVVLEWLQKVKSGVAPQTDADGIQQVIAIKRESMLDALERSGIARINNSRKEYENVKDDPAQRWIFVRSVIEVLIMYQGVAEVKNPFHDVMTPGYIPFFLAGVPETDTSIRQVNGFYMISDWPNPNAISPTLETVTKNFELLVGKARERVNRERNEVLRPDAILTVATAYDLPGTQHKISPMDSLKNLISFFERFPPQEAGRPFRKIYDSTLVKLKEIHENIENAAIGTASEADALEAILKSAELRYGTIVMQLRLELLIRTYIMDLLENSPPEQAVIAAQLLASDRFMDTLNRITGIADPGKIQDDLNGAMSITANNLNSFVKVFGKALTKQLKRLWEEEAASLPTIASKRRSDRSQLCHLLLGAEKVSKYVDVRYCKGTKLGPLVAGAPETKPLTVTSFDSDMGVRGCVLQDFNRARKIYTQRTESEKRLSVRRNLK